jgi:hypothetical protein
VISFLRKWHSTRLEKNVTRCNKPFLRCSSLFEIKKNTLLQKTFI